MVEMETAHASSVGLLSGGPGTYWLEPVARKEEVSANSLEYSQSSNVPEGRETGVEKVRGESRVVWGSQVLMEGSRTKQDRL